MISPDAVFKKIVWKFLSVYVRQDYVHRIGRTGRAGAKGEAFTLFTSDDARKAAPLVALMREAQQVIPPELENMAGEWKMNISTVFFLLAQCDIWSDICLKIF